MQLGLSLMIRPQDRSDLIRVQAIFASGGYNGAVYEYLAPDLNQLSTGTLPVAVATDPVGLSKDSSGNSNHAIQATAGARPTWSNRVNLLTYSEQFDNAAWAYTRWGGEATITPNDATYTAPDGTITADKVVATLGGSGIGESFTLTAGITYTLSIWCISPISDACLVFATTGASGSQVTSIQIPTSTSWVRFTTTYTPTVSGTYCGGVYDTVALQTFYVWGAQLEYGTTATRYQRVTTATDFDTAGFPYYLSFLGTDDSLTSATGGGGSAGFFWCGVVQPTDGAGTLRTLFADNGTNTGYKVQLDTSNKLSYSAGNNTAFTTKASTATVDVGTKYLLTVWDDGVNLNVQINSAAAETVARPVVVAGTAGFTIGKDNGAASSYSIANHYPSVYFKDTGLTAAQRAAAQAWARAKGGL